MSETETKDPNVGRVIDWGRCKKGEARTATIVARKQTHYQLDASDGTAGWISVENLERQDRRAGANAPAEVSGIIANLQRSASAMPSLQERAARMQDDMDRIRAGLDPLPMTEAERNRVLARLQEPSPALDAETAASVRRILDGHAAKKPDAGHAKRVDLAQRIEANVARLNEQRKTR